LQARGLARAGAPATAQASLQSGTQRTFLLGFRLPVDHPLQRDRHELQTLVVVRGGAHDTHGAAASFGKLFGLTAAELRVVEALRRDDHLPGAAAALGITHGTARTHLKTVFAKCGCQSQGALRELWAELTTAYIDFDASADATAPRQ
jgi:DNA-binding CsgD family transcriptional regulator